MPTNHIWSQQLLQTFPDAVSGMLLGVSAPVCDPGDKRVLHVNTGAIAVDMESHVVAAVGAAHGLPVAECALSPIQPSARCPHPRSPPCARTGPPILGP